MSRITKTVSDAQLSNIRQKFQEADDNNNGVLTVHELRRFLESVGWENPSENDAQDIMTKIAKGRDVVNFFTLMQTYDIWHAGLAKEEKAADSRSKLSNQAHPKPITLPTASATTPRAYPPAVSHSDDHAQEIVKLKEEVQSLRNRIAAHEANGESASEAQKSLAAAKSELASVEAEVLKQTSTLMKLKSDISEAQTVLADLEKSIAEQRASQEQASKVSAATKEQGSTSFATPVSAQAPVDTPSEPLSPESPAKKQKKKKRSMEAEDIAVDAVLAARSASKIGLLPKESPAESDQPQDRRMERSSTVGGAPASSPKKSKSKVLEKKKKPDDASPAIRRAVTSRKLGGDESPALSSANRKRRDSDGALRRAVLLPNRELPIEQLNAYYANHDDAIRKCQAFVKKFNARKRVRRLSSVVKDFAASEQSLVMRQRNSALKEIFTTERTYSESLKKLVDIYIQPLKKQRILDEDEMELMFSDIEVISDITGILLEKLEERLRLWPSVQRFGDIFRDSAPLMKLYYRYIRDFTKAQSRLSEVETKHPELTQFLQKQIEKAGGMALMSFLIMPVQRLPRYEMLLRALLKLTEPTHIDFQNLSDALDAVVHVNQYINQRKKEEELKAQIPQLLSRKTQEKIKATADEETEKHVRYLKITIEKARNLPPMDSNGLADPYATIAYDGENMKTKTKKETLSPDWKEDFVLAILPNSPDAFTICIIDYDRIGANEMMGWLEFKIADFLKNPEQSGWYPLLPPKGKAKKEKKHKAESSDSIGANSAPSSPSITHGEVYLQFHYVKEM